MQKKELKIIFVIIFLVILGYYNDLIISEIDYFYDDSNNFNLNPYRNTIYNNHEYTNQNIKVIFCPSNDCYLEYNNLFKNAKYEIKCAFYDFNNLNLSKTLLKKSEENIKISLIIDNDYLLKDSIKEFSNTKVQIYSDINRGTKYNNYMHHKFCVIDENILITGSTNPTENGFFNNNNNLIIIN